MSEEKSSESGMFSEDARADVEAAEEQKQEPGAGSDETADRLTEDDTVDAQAEEAPPEVNWEEVAASRYDQLLRLQADFDNYRRRMDRDREAIQGAVAERLLGDLLPVFDNLERALSYMPDEGEAKAWRVGVEMTLNGFLEALARLDVKPIESVGATFDPRFHEAVQRVESPEPEGTIVEEVQRGFTWHERVLRASMVKVSTGE